MQFLFTASTCTPLRLSPGNAGHSELYHCRPIRSIQERRLALHQSPAGMAGGPKLADNGRDRGKLHRDGPDKGCQYVVPAAHIGDVRHPLSEYRRASCPLYVIVNACRGHYKISLISHSFLPPNKGRSTVDVGPTCT